MEIQRIKYFTLIFIALLTSCCENSDMSSDRREYDHNLYYDTINEDSAILSSNLSFKTLLIDLGIKYPEVVYNQSVIESGHFKSNVFKRTKNCFGFHNGKNYLEFNSIKECCQFYKSWQDKYYKSGDYLVFLSDYGYAKDTNYVNLLKRM